MTDGMIGADAEQLRELAKTMETSGTALKQLSTSLNSVITGARWNVPDSERFRSQWHNGMRLKPRSTGDVLAQYSRILNDQADEQIQASVASGLPAGPGDPLRVGPGDDGVANLSLDDMAAANSNPAYQTGNLLASFRGTQLLNGLSMAGRAAGVLSIIGGGAQFANGLMDGNTSQMLDGGVTTVLGVGSFIPVVGPAFAVAGIAWAGMGVLSNSLGYDSTSEVVGDGAKWVGEQSANVAKKAWGWLSGG